VTFAESQRTPIGMLSFLPGVSRDSSDGWE
jgi:hypothetical protein